MHLFHRQVFSAVVDKGLRFFVSYRRILKWDVV